MLGFLIASPAGAQSADSTFRQVFVDAGVFEGEAVARPDGSTERVERLSRGVRVRQDSTTLTSQRATRFLDRALIVFEGDVRVVERGDTLRSASLRYSTSTKIGDASGSVRLTDGEVVVTSPSARYDTKTKRSSFDDGVQLVDSSAILTARRGTYDSGARRAVFADSVRLADGLSRVAADTLIYLRDVRQSDARGGVRMRRYEPAGAADSVFALTKAPGAADLPDTLGSVTWLWGARAQSDEEAGTVAVQGDPLMVRIRSGAGRPSDTLVVRARTLDLLDADTLQTLTARGDVRIWTPEYSALSDSAFTRRTPPSGTSASRERVDLLRLPIAWFDDAQLTGDTLRFHASGGALDSLHARGSGFVAQLDSASERLHQLSAAVVRLTVLPDSAYLVDARPQARVVRFLVGDDGQPDGAIQASGDVVQIRSREGRVRSVHMEAVEGTQYAEHLVPPALRLEGLNWQPDRRPLVRDLLGDSARALHPREALVQIDLPMRPASGPLVPAPPDPARGDSVRADSVQADTTTIGWLNGPPATRSFLRRQESTTATLPAVADPLFCDSGDGSMNVVLDTPWRRPHST